MEETRFDDMSRTEIEFLVDDGNEVGQRRVYGFTQRILTRQRSELKSAFQLQVIEGEQKALGHAAQEEYAGAHHPGEDEEISPQSVAHSALDGLMPDFAYQDIDQRCHKQHDHSGKQYIGQIFKLGQEFFVQPVCHVSSPPSRTWVPVRRRPFRSRTRRN